MKWVPALSTAPDPKSMLSTITAGRKVQPVPQDSKKPMLTDRDVQHDGPRVDMKDKHSRHQNICFPRTCAYIFIVKN